MSLNFTQGDTGPDVTAIIHDEGDPLAPTNLTGATVRFQMRFPDGSRYKVNAAATITDAVAGAVLYAWGANDLAQHGTFEAQWEVTHSGGKTQTTYPPVVLAVRRQ